MKPDDMKFDDGEADAAIDRAVREMMSAEPRADFGRRVRARLECPARIVFTIPRLAAVAALTAAVALFVLTRDNRPTPPPPRVAVHTAPVTRPGPTTPDRPAVTPEVPRTMATEAPERATPAPDRPVQAASIDVSELADVAADVEPLKAIAPIALSVMTQEPITKPEIRITPLDVSPIEIAPLITPRRAACEESAC
jgi:hypothetical protein